MSDIKKSSAQIDASGLSDARVGAAVEALQAEFGGEHPDEWTSGSWRAAARAVLAAADAVAAPQAVPAGYWLAPINLTRHARLHLLNGESSWDALRSLLAAAKSDNFERRFTDDSAASPPPSAERGWLLLAMDDDRVAHPTHCADRSAIFQAVKVNVLGDGAADMDEDDLEQCSAIVETLMEDGVMRFEGDPPLHLFRLPAAPATKEEGHD